MEGFGDPKKVEDGEVTYGLDIAVLERSVCVVFQCTFQRHPRPRTYLNGFTGKTSYSLQEGTSASQLD